MPRQERPSFVAGKKRANFDRVEWIIPNAATAAAAIQSGEADWWPRAAVAAREWFSSLQQINPILNAECLLGSDMLRKVGLNVERAQSIRPRPIAATMNYHGATRERLQNGMTWSIVTFDKRDGAFAIAVATKNLAVGAAVPHLRSGVGAVATQSITNRYLGPVVLDAMARGLSPSDAITSAISADAGRGLRQIHAVDRHGRTAVWTGENCVMWCGSVADGPVSVAGNMLANETVVPATLAAFIAASALPLPEQLMAAMLAGDAAGGDRRGRQSAAMTMTTTEDFPDLSLRVDDHATPLVELQRILGLWRRDRAPTLDRQPRRADPAGQIDLDAIEAPWIAGGTDLRLRRS